MTRQQTIRFNAEMARANWEGRKTAASWPMKPQPQTFDQFYAASNPEDNERWPEFACKYRVGQTLLVKEPWTLTWEYKDTTFDFHGDLRTVPDNSRSMLLEDARQAITITRITARRLEDIDEAGALAEGFVDSRNDHAGLSRIPLALINARHNYLDAMRRIYKLPDKANPWVRQIDYTTKRITK